MFSLKLICWCSSVRVVIRYSFSLVIPFLAQNYDPSSQKRSKSLIPDPIKNLLILIPWLVNPDPGANSSPGSVFLSHCSMGREEERPWKWGWSWCWDPYLIYLVTTLSVWLGCRKLFSELWLACWLCFFQKITLGFCMIMDDCKWLAFLRPYENKLLQIWWQING